MIVDFKAAILAALVALLIGATVAGIATHRYDQAQHEQTIAELEATAAKTLAAETTKVLERERAARIHLDNLETAYARLSEERAQASADSVRLSADLAAAVERLRRVGSLGRGAGGVPAADAGADRCADVRAALGRAAGALELLQTAGDQAAADGQHAVDVATVAAQAARTNGDER